MQYHRAIEAILVLLNCTLVLYILLTRTPLNTTELEASETRIMIQLDAISKKQDHFYSSFVSGDSQYDRSDSTRTLSSQQGR